eukprot:g1553.t1
MHGADCTVRKKAHMKKKMKKKKKKKEWNGRAGAPRENDIPEMETERTNRAIREATRKSQERRNIKYLALRSRVANLRQDRAEIVGDICEHEQKIADAKRHIDSLRKSKFTGTHTQLEKHRLLRHFRSTKAFPLDSSDPPKPSDLIRIDNLRSQIEDMSRNVKALSKAYDTIVAEHEDVSRTLRETNSARADAEICVARAEARKRWRAMCSRSESTCTKHSTFTKEHRRRDQIEKEFKEATVELVRVKQSRTRADRLHRSAEKEVKEEWTALKSTLEDESACLRAEEDGLEEAKAAWKSIRREDRAGELEEHIRRLRLSLQRKTPPGVVLAYT